MAITEILNSKCFGGYQKSFLLNSEELSSETKFAIYLPPNAEKERFPVLYWLSGLHSDQDTFILQSGAQRYASEHGVCIVCPDTSPRDVDIPGQEDSLVIGAGAGFYLDATRSPWNKHYRMFSYITSELIKVVNDNFPVIPDKQSIAGFSMGGHGALICALKNPGLYCSVSALEPVTNLSITNWGRKICSEYLGDDEKAWLHWDAAELVKKYRGPYLELFIDQVADDCYYEDEILLPPNIVEAGMKNQNIKVILKMRDGYDHSYYYVSSVIEDHIEYHSKFLHS